MFVSGDVSGMVGKWHLSPYEDDGLDCLSLDETPDADKWDACTAVVKDLGFAFVDAWFYSNIVQNADFSHNPEWMVERSQAFIEEAQTLEKPFFLCVSFAWVVSVLDINLHI